MELTINTPKREELEAESRSFLAVAETCEIKTAEEYTRLAKVLQDIKGKINALDERRKKITGPLDTAKKSVMDLFRAPVDILTKAELLIKNAMLDYDREEERKRKAEEDRLREIARQEQQRIYEAAIKAQREAAAKEAETRRKAEEAAAAGKEAEAAKLAAKANAAAEKSAAKVADMQQQAESIATPVVVREPVKVAGISKAVTWHARIIDPLKVPRRFHVIDHAALDAEARKAKGPSTIPGVEFYSEETIKSGASR